MQNVYAFIRSQDMCAWGHDRGNPPTIIPGAYIPIEITRYRLN